MAEAEPIKLAISLEEHVSKPAEKAGASLEHLHTGLEEGKAGLAELSLGFLKVVEPAEVAHKAFEEAGEGLRSFVSGLKSGEAKGAIEGLTEAVAGFSQILDLVVPGLGQVASAAIKMAGSVVGGFVGILQSGEEMALEVAEVNERLTATFDALGNSGPESGKRTLDMLDKLSTKLPQTRDQLATWTKELEKAGVTDLGELQHQLKATAAAQAAFGDDEGYLKVTAKIQNAVATTGKLTLNTKTFLATVGGVKNATDVAEKMHLSLTQLEKGLKAGTVNAQEFGNALSATMIEKGEKPLDAMGNELGTLKTKGKEALGHLFDDVDASPITDALKSLIDIGDQSEPSGKALKSGFTGAFNAISKMIGHAIIEFKHFFLQMEVYALEAKIKLDPLIHTLEKVGVIKKGGGPTSGVSDAAKGYKPPEHRYTGKSAAKDMAKAETNSLVVGATMGPLVGAMYLAGKAIKAGFDLGVQADTDKSRAAGAAMSNAAIDGAREAAQAHSPSRLTMQLGMHMSQGLAQGMDRSADIPERAGRRITGSAIGGMARGAMGGGQSSGGRGTQIDKFEVNVTAPNGVTDAHQISATALAVALERYQLASGR